MRVVQFFCILAVLGALCEALATASPYPGYTDDVSTEKSERFYEVYLFVPPPPKSPTLQEMIFNPLSKEFKEKYREKFGELDTASISYRSSAMGGTTETPHVVEEQNKKRKAFAEYMTRRLLEHHFDNYMRTQPQMRPVMEVKDQIQNVKVEVNKEVRLNIQYNFAGNVADVIVDNPWCESKLALEMNPSSFGPSEVQESRIWLSKDLNTRLKANSNVAINDGIAYADLARSFGQNPVVMTLGLSSAFKEGGTSAREVKYIVGVSHSF